MKGFLRRVLARIDRRFFDSLRSTLDDSDVKLGEITARLAVVEDSLERLNLRLADVQGVVESTMARAASSSERSLGVVESQARLGRRVEEIERLLGGSSQASVTDR